MKEKVKRPFFLIAIALCSIGSILASNNNSAQSKLQDIDSVVGYATAEHVANDSNLTIIPILSGKIGSDKAKIQLVFNNDNNVVTGWYCYAHNMKAKRKFKGTYDGGPMSCTITLEEIELDEGSYDFEGDFAYGYMSGTEFYDFSGKVIGYGDMEEAFHFEEQIVK